MTPVPGSAIFLVDSTVEYEGSVYFSVG